MKTKKELIVIIQAAVASVVDVNAEEFPQEQQQQFINSAEDINNAITDFISNIERQLESITDDAWDALNAYNVLVEHATNFSQFIAVDATHLVHNYVGNRARGGMTSQCIDQLGLDMNVYLVKLRYSQAFARALDKLIHELAKEAKEIQDELTARAEAAKKVLSEEKIQETDHSDELTDDAEGLEVKRNTE